MGITQRTPRPICRDEKSFRDDKLFIIASDDTYAPKQYFDFFHIPRVQVHVIATVDGTSSAEYVLDRLLKVEHEEYDELWMVLDTDHYTDGAHVKKFVDAIKRAKKKGIKIALSKPCFEIWLLLHHLDAKDIIVLENAKQTAALLRSTLGGYNKTKLKPEHYPPSLVVEAYHRTKELDAVVAGGDIPADNTSRLYLLWESILSSALPSQLTSEFRVLMGIHD